MKKSIILLALVAMTAINTTVNAQVGLTPKAKIGIVIYSNDEETMWNALRLANFAKENGNEVNVFLLGKGVELDKLVKTNENLAEQTQQFLDAGGNIMGCGTCLASRKNNEPQYCKFSSMDDLYQLIMKSDKVLTF